MSDEDILVETRNLLAAASSEPWSQSALAGAYVVGSKEDNFPVICSLGEYDKDGTLELEFENSVNNMSVITRAPKLLRNLADEVERHRAIMEMRLDKETLLKHFRIEDGEMDIAVNPPEFIRKMLAVLFLTAMDDAPNFQTACLTWKADNYELTIRKIDGNLPLKR